MSLPVLYFMSLSIKNIVLTYCELLALVFKHTGVTISLYTNEALYSELLSSQRLSDVLEHSLCIVFTIFISCFLWTIKMLFNSLLQSYFLMTDIQKSEYEYQHLLLASNQIKGENKQSYISVFYSLASETRIWILSCTSYENLGSDLASFRLSFATCKVQIVVITCLNKLFSEHL